MTALIIILAIILIAAVTLGFIENSAKRRG